MTVYKSSWLKKHNKKPKGHHPTLLFVMIACSSIACKLNLCTAMTLVSSEKYTRQ